MALIPVKQALENIMKAKHGEEVRTSIHDAIFIMDKNANEAVDVAITSKDSAKSYADSAEASKNTAKDEADRAKDEADRAASIVHVDVATTTTPGIVKPDGETINVSADGTGTISVSDSIADLPEYLLEQKDKGFLESENVLNPSLKSDTTRGVTCTRMSDGSYVLNGTASPSAKFTISTEVFDGEYYVSGCPSGGDNSSYKLEVLDKNNQYPTDFGNGVFVQGGIKEIAIIILSGYTANNLVFKPMVSKRLIPYNDYKSFARPNTELTEKIYDVEKQVFSKNRYNPLDVENGYLYNSSGAKQSVATWGIAHIKVKGLSTISISGLKNFSSVNVSYRWEDGNKTAISSIPYARLNNANGISVPSGAEYIGVSVIIDSTASNYGYDKLQVEEGTTATSYVPYAKSNVELAEELADIQVQLTNKIGMKDIGMLITTEANPEGGRYFKEIDVSYYIPSDAKLISVGIGVGNWNAGEGMHIKDNKMFLLTSMNPINNGYRKFRLVYCIF